MTAAAHQALPRHPLVQIPLAAGCSAQHEHVHVARALHHPVGVGEREAEELVLACRRAVPHGVHVPIIGADGRRLDLQLVAGDGVADEDRIRPVHRGEAQEAVAGVGGAVPGSQVDEDAHWILVPGGFLEHPRHAALARLLCLGDEQGLRTGAGDDVCGVGVEVEEGASGEDGAPLPAHAAADGDGPRRQPQQDLAEDLLRH
jgi:hypothetical protein